MSLLPQRKKSAEEIAKLRETLGILPAAEGSSAEGAPDGEPTAEAATPPAAAATAVEIPASGATPTAEIAPATSPAQQTQAVRSTALEPAGSDPAGVLPDPARRGKPVRSLRKSEQRPPVAENTKSTPAADSSLPFHRHSARELDQIRRQAAISRHVNPPAFVNQVAHLALVIPGYLLALSAGLGIYFYHLDIGFSTGCVSVALLIAVYIFIKKPLSRHHAGFISVIAILVIVFGALHYFPQLRHGS